MCVYSMCLHTRVSVWLSHFDTPAYFTGCHVVNGQKWDVWRFGLYLGTILNKSSKWAPITQHFSPNHRASTALNAPISCLSGMGSWTKKRPISFFSGVFFFLENILLPCSLVIKIIFFLCATLNLRYISLCKICLLLCCLFPNYTTITTWYFHSPI